MKINTKPFKDKFATSYSNAFILRKPKLVVRHGLTVSALGTRNRKIDHSGDMLEGEGEPWPIRFQAGFLSLCYLFLCEWVFCLFVGLYAMCMLEDQKRTVGSITPILAHLPRIVRSK